MPKSKKGSPLDQQLAGHDLQEYMAEQREEQWKASKKRLAFQQEVLGVGGDLLCQGEKYFAREPNGLPRNAVSVILDAIILLEEDTMMMTVVPERQTMGFYNIHEAAKMLNIVYQTLRQNIQRGEIPRPSNRIGRRYYYSASDIDKLAEFFASRKRFKSYAESRTWEGSK